MSSVELATAYVSIIPEVSGIRGRIGKALAPGEQEAAAAGKKQGGRFAGAFKAGIVGIGGALAAVGIGKFVTDAVKGAGELQQSIGAIESVFGKSSGKMQKWSASAAQNVGLTKNEFNELGTVLGAQLKNGGVAMDKLAPKTNKLIGLGADMSAMFGGTTKEAVEAVSAALRGERDTIEKYGVSLTQASVDAKAAELGFKKVGGALSQEATQAATVALIMEQTADAHGTFAKEADTFAGAQQRMTAQWGNLVTKVGGFVIPIMTKLFKWISETGLPALKRFGGWIMENVVPAFKSMGKWIKENKSVLTLLATVLGTAAAAYAAYTIATKAWTAATKLGTLAQKLFNKALAMNPIMKVVLVIGALVGALIWLYNNNKTAKRIIDAAWNGIKNAVKFAWEKVIKPAFQAIWGFVKKYLIPIITWLWKNIVKPYFKAIGAIIKWAWNTLIKPAFKAIWGFIKNHLIPWVTKLWKNTIKPAFKKIGAAIKWAWEKVIKPAFKALWAFIKDDLIPWFQRLWKKVKPVMNWIGEKVRKVWNKWIKPAFNAIKDAVGKIPNAFEKAKDGIGKAWDKLKSIAKKPIRFVVNKVINDGLIDTFNKIPGVDIPNIRLPRGFAKGGLAPRGWAMVGEEGPELVNFSNPGRVYTAAQTGAALKHTEDGSAAVGNSIVGGGFGAIWGPFQDAIRRAGKLFVGGGAGPAWQIGQAASMWDRLAGLRVRGGSGYPQASTSVGGLPSWMLAWATGAGNITFNNQGMAPGLSPQMKRATAAHEIGHVLGFPHTNAASIMQPVMGKYMQPTAFDKRRLESLYGEGARKAGGPLGPPPNPFLGLVDKMVDAIRERFPAGGMFIDAAVGLAKAGINKVTDWVGDLAKGLGDKIAGVAGSVVNGIKGFFGFAAKAPGTLYDNGGRIGAGTTLVDNQSRKPEALLNSRQWSTAHRAMNHVEKQANGANFPTMMRLVVGDREFDAYVDTRAVAATGGALNSADNRLRFGGKYVGGLK